MVVRHFLISAGFFLALAVTAKAQNILYQHDFSGSAATPLHRQAVDIDHNGGGANWVTRTDTGLISGTGREWYADGHIDTTIDPNVNGSASLGFAPIAGNIYTLSARFNAISTVGGGEAYNWVGLGFSSGYATGAGGGAEFFGNGQPDQVLGQPWMLVRASNAQFPNQFALGPGVTGIANWPTPITDNGGDPVDLRIVLNTTTPLWSVEWLAKKPADATYTSLGTASYTTNPTIRDITIADNYNIAGSIDSLTLTTSGLVYTAGDTNGTGVVDLFDYDTIRNNFFKSLQGPTNGDLNNDGVVDYVDFRVWKNHATPAALAALGIPEPASALLGVIGFVLLAPLSMRSRRR